MNAHAIPEAPANIEAEQALLGAILVNNEAFNIVRGQGLDGDHFSETIHRLIFEACGKVIEGGTRANPVTIKGFLPQGEMVGDMTLPSYLAHLAVNATTIINCPDYAQAVKVAWARKGMMAASQWLTSAAANAMQESDDFDLADTILSVRARLAECVAAIEGNASDGTSFADAAATSQQATMDAVSGKKVTGIDYKIPALMQLIGPLMAGKLIVVGGLTKHGKSSLAQQIARGSADQGHLVFYYSGEMDANEIIMREKARDTGISVKHQTEGKVSAGELERLTIASQTISQLPFVVQDKRRTLDQLIRGLKTFAAHAKRKGIMPVGIVDSMLLLDRDKGQARMMDYEFGALVTDRLKAAARDLDMPIIVLGQLKKNTVDKSFRGKIDANHYRQAIARRPRASDLYGSCEKDADHVVIVYNPEVILRDMEPAEGTDEYLAWEGVLDEFKGKAEILLSLSRSAHWPARRTVQWDGARHHFSFKSDEQRGFF